MRTQTRPRPTALSTGMLLTLTVLIPLTASAQQRAAPGWSKLDRFLGSPALEKNPDGGEDEGGDEGGKTPTGGKGATEKEAIERKETLRGNSLELKNNAGSMGEAVSALENYQIEAISSLNTSLFKLTNFHSALSPQIILASDLRTKVLKTTRSCASSGLWDVGELPDGTIESNIRGGANGFRKASVATTGVIQSNGCPTIGAFVKYLAPAAPYNDEDGNGDALAVFKRIASRVTLKANGSLSIDRISPSQDGVMPPYLRRNSADSLGSYPDPAFLNNISLPNQYLTSSVIPLGMGASGRDIYGSASYIPTGGRLNAQAFWFDQGSNDLGNFSSARFTHLGDIGPNASGHCGWSSAAYGQSETANDRIAFGFGTLDSANAVPNLSPLTVRDRCVQGQRKAVVFPLSEMSLPPVNSPDGYVLDNQEVIATSPDGQFKVMNYLDNQSQVASAQFLDTSRSSEPMELSISRVNEAPPSWVRTQAEDLTVSSSGQQKVFGTRFTNQIVDGYPLERSEAVIWNNSGQLETVIGSNLLGRGSAADIDYAYASSLETRAAVKSSTGRDIVVGTAFTTNVPDGSGSARPGFSCINVGDINTTFDSEYLADRKSREAWIWDGASTPRSLEEYAMDTLPRDQYGEAVRAQLNSWEFCEAHDVMHKNGVTVVIGEGIHHPPGGIVRRKGFMLVLGKALKEGVSEFGDSLPSNLIRTSPINRL